ncbi:ribosomal protein S18-alanine N-acetyltransferase [Laribacter hongkongensis]|uniref:ribosomal protein S18-alanine N-acetyltransferase n=1 Tax=Laribacter hongkongensis TaxID=168471 RepID=UPI001EFC757A|nr:ribosomal protein S18-alanine N-acetyltransferase [Laribacter hongkongensis]MCG9052727.1 ribosomal protein S18-alanine N-acetyltransferase [Laribacter hongkongensis]MCG9106539.1 ribosomal protein S18-alanine N-acetyltransferase [Laribacter hongkongensis]
MNHHLRQARAADMDILAGMAARSQTGPWSAGQLLDSLKAGHAITVLEQDGHPIGFAVVQVALDEAELLEIVIDHPHQRHGWARRLLDHLQRQLRQQGVNRLLLEVREGNLPALSLYRQYGLTEFGRRRGYYPAAGGREDAILMDMPI